MSKVLTDEQLKRKREYTRLWMAKWRKENPEREKEKRRKWRLANLEKERARVKEVSRKIRERNPNRSRDYYHAHEEEMKEKNKAWYAANRESESQKYKKWAQENREHRLSLNHRRRATLKSVGGSYTVQEWKALCRKYNHRCLCCGKRKPLTVDHVVPISKGGPNTIDNIQPLCGSCNSRKNKSIIDYRHKQTRRKALIK